MPRFYIVETVYPAPHGRVKKYRIVERQPTCDGTRDRITERCFETLEEAIHETKILEVL